MRISTFSIVVAVSLGGALAWPATQAFAVQDTPFTVGGVEAVCTGVGSAKDDPRWASYPVKLVFANPAGEFVAAVHVTVQKGGATVLETDCDAPWLLVKAPAGDYSVTAMINDASHAHANASFSTGGLPQKTVNVTFPGKN